MLATVLNIDFNDMGEAVPGFIAIIAMPFMYSISEGIALGIISYVVINVLSGAAGKKEYQRYYVYTGIFVCFEIYFRLKLKIVMAGPANFRLFF